MISLTDSGRALQARAEDIPLRMACLGVLTPAEGAELKRLSETLYRNLLALEQLRANPGDNEDGLAG